MSHFHSPMFLFVLCAAFAAQAFGATSITIGESSGEVGTMVTTPVAFETDDVVAMAQLELVYDASVVAVTAVTGGSSLNGHIVDFETPEDGRTIITVTATSLINLSTGNLVTIEAELLQEVAPTASAFSITNVILSDAGDPPSQVAVDLLPYVRVISPADGGVAGAGVANPVTAVAIDTNADGSIVSVAFTVGGVSIGTATSAPFSVTWTPISEGAAVITAVATDDDANSATVMSDVNVVDPGLAAFFNTNFDSFQITDPAIAGLLADPDGDGIPNLLEYALGLSPLTASRDQLPALTTTDVDSDSFVSISYTRPNDLTGIVYTVEASSDLESWDGGTTEVADVSETDNQDGTTTVVKRDARPLASEERRVMRLSVTLD